MTDKGQLALSADADLSRLAIATDGYSSIRRGAVTLYPIRNADGKLYFSRGRDGDKAPGNSNPLVDLIGNWTITMPDPLG